MHYLQLTALAASLAFAPAQAIRGFNTGNIGITGVAKQQSDFEAEFKNQQQLVGTNGEFTSARLYTMIQGGTTNDVISAIPAALSTKTGLLLGLWASAGQEAFNNELAALKSAISTYGSNFANLVDGISVGSEDLYRITPTGIENDAGIGAGPDVIANYIGQVRDTIRGTALQGAQIGHVDTWTAWVNGSNANVVSACDWIGVDAYPYYQTVNTNPIENAGDLFYSALDMTRANSQGKTVWVTETGWPVEGPVQGQAVASVANARSYWEQVYCTLPDDVPVYWYTQSDADQASGVGSFGVVGNSLQTTPLYSLSCKNVNTNTTSSSSSQQSSTGGSSTTSSSQAISTNSFLTQTGTQAVSTPSSNAVVPGPAYSTTTGSGAPVSTGTPPATTSPASFDTNSAAGLRTSVGLLAIPALLALLL